VNLQFETAWRLHQFLSQRGIPCVIIGGIAVQRWGQPRFTRDVDLTILLPAGQEEPALREILRAFPGRVDDALQFAIVHRVLPVRVPGGSEADITLGLPGYEEGVVARGVDYDLGDGRVVRLCSAEDLIIHKAVAGRPQDLVDVEGIVVRQRDRLDLTYLRGWLGEFSALLDDPEVAQRFERAWEEYLKRSKLR
jgi:hypothetical protein